MFEIKAGAMAAILLVVAITVGWVTWDFQEGRFARKEAQRLSDEAELARLNRASANAAAVIVETKKAANEVRYRTITREIEKIVDRPVYLNQCIDDDGLRLLNDQIKRRATADPSQLQPTVP